MQAPNAQGGFPQQNLPPPGYAQPPPGYGGQQQQLPPVYAQPPPMSMPHPQQQQMYMGPGGVPMNQAVMSSLPMAVPQYQPQQVQQYQQPAKPYVPGQRTNAQKEKQDNRSGCAGFCACLMCGC